MPRGFGFIYSFICVPDLLARLAWSALTGRWHAAGQTGTDQHHQETGKCTDYSNY